MVVSFLFLCSCVKTKAHNRSLQTTSTHLPASLSADLGLPVCIYVKVVDHMRPLFEMPLWTRSIEFVRF